MSPEVNNSGGTLSREDEILVRVVLDLGLAKQENVDNAVAHMQQSNLAGTPISLADSLQQTGALHPRFVKAVMKAVNTKMASGTGPTAAAPTAPGPTAPAPQQTQQPQTGYAQAPPAQPQTGYGQQPPTGVSNAPGQQPPTGYGQVPPQQVQPQYGQQPPHLGQQPPQQGQQPPQTGYAQVPPQQVQPQYGQQPPTGYGQVPPQQPPEQPEPMRQLGAREDENVYGNRSDDLRNIHIPDAVAFKDAPKGEGFSRRSKTSIQSAWAAHKAKQGGGSSATAPTGSPPSGSNTPATDNPAPTPSSPLGGSGLPSAPPEVPGRANNPLADLLNSTPTKPPVTPADPRPSSGLGSGISKAPKKAANPLSRLVGNNPGAIKSKPSGAGKPADKGPVPAAPQKRKFASSGMTQSINLNDLRAELGIDDSKPKEPEPKPISPQQQKEIALKAFTMRFIKSTLHHTCLDAIVRKRITEMTSARLATETGGKERDIRKVLDDWSSSGLVKIHGQGYGATSYRFTPAKADLESIKNLMKVWRDPIWRNKLMSWMVAK